MRNKHSHNHDDDDAKPGVPMSVFYRGHFRGQYHGPRMREQFAREEARFYRSKKTKRTPPKPSDS